MAEAESPHDAREASHEDRPAPPIPEVLDRRLGIHLQLDCASTEGRPKPRDHDHRPDHLPMHMVEGRLLRAEHDRVPE